MLRSYFDTNVYGKIAAGKVPAEHVDALRTTLADGRLFAPVSPANIDELFGQLETDRLAMVSGLATMRTLVGFHGMLKQPRDILRDAIEAYAAGIKPPPVTLPESERRMIVAFLSDVIAGSVKHDNDLRRIVGDVDALKDQWLANMREAQRQVQADPDWGRRTRRERQTLAFSEYFAAGALDMADAFALPLGCAEACRQQGLAGLLEYRPVRLCVGVAKSQIYAQIIGTPGHRDLRLPARSDGYDIWHAILASTADVFVTFDERLADHVERVPGLDNFRVVRSIPALLAAIGSTTSER
jgi:hypothetical protein